MSVVGRKRSHTWHGREAVQRAGHLTAPVTGARARRVTHGPPNACSALAPPAAACASTSRRRYTKHEQRRGGYRLGLPLPRVGPTMIDPLPAQRACGCGMLRRASAFEMRCMGVRSVRRVDSPAPQHCSTSAGDEHSAFVCNDAEKALWLGDPSHWDAVVPRPMPAHGPRRRRRYNPLGMRRRRAKCSSALRQMGTPMSRVVSAVEFTAA